MAQVARPAPSRDRRRNDAAGSHLEQATHGPSRRNAAGYHLEQATHGPSRPRGTRYSGWGSLNPYNPRAAYRHVADFSIYVERAYRGRGVGKLVLTRLIELAREIGYHKLVLSAFPFNAAGMALYVRQGFRTVGIFKEQGLLDGRWVDTIVMEKLL